MIQWGIQALFIFSLFVLASCTPPVQSTLLRDREECTVDNGCVTEQQKTIAGDLSITPDATNMTLNVDQSDIIEISGSCRDLGRSDHRIIVQAFEGEDESVAPYLNNSESFNCGPTSTTSPAALQGQRCLWSGIGNSLIPADTPTTEYPRCINGRFSFSVRVGKILRDGASELRNYLIRMQIGTTDSTQGRTASSAFGRVVVSRSVSKPTFSVSSPAAADTVSLVKCEVKVNPFRGARIAYELKREMVASYGTLAPILNVYEYFEYRDGLNNIIGTRGILGVGGPLGVSFPDPDFGLQTGTSVQKFYDEDVLPGVTYNYSVRALDLKYSNGLENSGYTEIASCKPPMPVPVSCECAIGGSCLATISRPTNGKYEWNFRTESAAWPASYPGGGVSLPCGNSGEVNCPLTVPANSRYYLSVRATSEDSTIKGEWMPQAVECIGR